MENSVYEDIKMALTMIEGQKMIEEQMISDDSYLKNLAWAKKSKPFSKISPSYLFSNENLFYYENFFMNNQKVLTVTGSGDQVLTAILYGAREVDTFDSNKLAYYNLMLKKYALLSMDYNELLDFYNVRKDISYLRRYKKIAESIIEDDVRYFWQQILNQDKYNFSYCFLGFGEDFDILKKRIPYINKEYFEKIKIMIPECKINYKNIDIFEIPNEFTQKYSFINLSNILQYIVDKQSYIDFIKNLATNNLIDGGSILLNYYWHDLEIGDLINKDVYEKCNAQAYTIDDLATQKYKKESGSIMVYTKRLK